jgi:hypothetical protein
LLGWVGLQGHEIEDQSNRWHTFGTNISAPDFFFSSMMFTPFFPIIPPK